MSVQKDKLFHCSFCDKNFCQHNQLVEHTRKHNGDKPFKCGYCSKSFASPKVLKVHERVHTGEKPYKCIYCDKNFSAYANLVVHRRIHTNEKPYVCKLCCRGFEHSGNLTRHFRAHLIDSGFRCILCGCVFQEENKLMEHTKTDHLNEYTAYMASERCKASVPQVAAANFPKLSPQGNLPLQNYNSIKYCEEGTIRPNESGQGPMFHEEAMKNVEGNSVDSNKYLNSINEMNRVYLNVSSTKSCSKTERGGEQLNDAVTNVAVAAENTQKSTPMSGLREIFLNKKYAYVNTNEHSSSNNVFDPFNYNKDTLAMFHDATNHEIQKYIGKGNKTIGDEKLNFFKNKSSETTKSLPQAFSTATAKNESSRNMQETPLSLEPPPLIPIDELESCPDGSNHIYELTPLQPYHFGSRNDIHDKPFDDKHEGLFLNENYGYFENFHYLPNPFKTALEGFSPQKKEKLTDNKSPNPLLSVAREPIHISFPHLFNPDIQQDFFKRKIERAMCALVGVPAMRQFGYPGRNCEQVLICILDKIKVNPCADVRVDEMERLEINVWKLLAHSFPNEKAWDCLGWRGKPLEFILDQIEGQNYASFPASKAQNQMHSKDPTNNNNPYSTNQTRVPPNLFFH